MQAFQLHQPTSLANAAQLRSGKDDARFLAGGQSLLAAMKLGLNSATDLVNLAALPELVGIKVEGNSVVVGAMTRHADVAANADVKRLIPALAALAGGIGDRQVRNMGTLGGSIANADPAACYPAAVVGLGATVRTNKREIAADDFFRGFYETALAEDEIVTSVSFPVPQKAAYVFGRIRLPLCPGRRVCRENSWWRARRRDGGGRLGISGNRYRAGAQR